MFEDLSLLDILIGGLVGGALIFGISLVKRIRKDPTLPSNTPPTYHKEEDLKVTNDEKEKIREKIKNDSVAGIVSWFNNKYRGK